jgi:hypothetical protein
VLSETADEGSAATNGLDGCYLSQKRDDRIATPELTHLRLQL